MVIGRSAKNKQAPDASGMDSTPGARVRRETSPVREGANINAVIVLPPRKHVNAGGVCTENLNSDVVVMKSAKDRV
jgi:hypothetical protein